jgi:uncharacterized protein with HEPN domain
MSPLRLDFLKHIESECAFIRKFCLGKTKDEIFEDEVLLRAIIRSVEIIGEAVKKLDDDFKLKYPEVEWKKISKTRDRLIHHYYGIDHEILWNIISAKIPALHDQLSEIIREESNS